uniref:hypothetical protein n=1 Tax=Nitrosomonas sp. TaxID=42353 RepID=UPI0025FC68D6
NESDCSRDFSKEITKKYPDIHITIRNCNEFYNSLDFAKVSICINCEPMTLMWSNLPSDKQVNNFQMVLL